MPYQHYCLASSSASSSHHTSSEECYLDTCQNSLDNLDIHLLHTCVSESIKMSEFSDIQVRVSKLYFPFLLPHHPIKHHFPFAGAGGPGLPTYKVSDHSHRHQAREHPGVCWWGLHSQAGLWGNTVAEDGTQASWLPRWVMMSVFLTFLTQ